MTNDSKLVSEKKLVSVVMLSSGSREITLANLKQLFSMKPEHWRLDVHLIIEGANEATLSLIESLDSEIQVFPVSGRLTASKCRAKVARNLAKDSEAALWLGANTIFKSDTYNQIANFHRQYPSSILIGQFQDEVTSQISAGGCAKPWALFGKKDLLLAEKLPADVAGFDQNLVFIPHSAFSKIGHPTGWLDQLNTSALFVARAKRKRIRCLAIPGNLGTVLR